MTKISNVDKMIANAVELKKQGRFNQSLNMYTAAIREEPSNSNLYRSIGQVAYLMNNRNLAVAAYLSALHIEIAKIEHFGLTEQTRPMYDNLPENLKKDLPVQGAFLLYYDTNTLRNLAHAIADFDEEALKNEPQLEQYKEIYAANLQQTTERYQALLEKHEITEEEYIENEETFYIPIGKELALSWIHWRELSSLDVGKMYFGVEPATHNNQNNDNAMDGISRLYDTLFSQLTEFIDRDAMHKELNALLIGIKTKTALNPQMYEQNVLQGIVELNERERMLIEIISSMIRDKKALTQEEIQEKLAVGEKELILNLAKGVTAAREKYNDVFKAGVTLEKREKTLALDYKMHTFLNSLLMDLTIMLSDNESLLTRLAKLPVQDNELLIKNYCGSYTKHFFE